MQIRVTFPKTDGGFLYVYEPNTAGQERLVGVMLDVETLTPEQWAYFRENLRYEYPTDGKVCGSLAATPDTNDARKLEAQTKGKLKKDKIALFCAIWFQKFKVQYVMQKYEPKLVDNVEFTDELLRIYFETDAWWNKDKSLANYVRNYNTLVLKQLGVHTFPDRYDPAVEKALAGDNVKAPAYYSHIRALGWTPRKGATNNGMVTVGWENFTTGEFVPKNKG